LRAELGYRRDEKVCIVSVDGSGVGHHLLRRVMESHAEARRREPALRMIVMAGPRIDPASVPRQPGLEVVAYVHNLYRHFAACDLAVLQGRLTTSMELAALLPIGAPSSTSRCGTTSSRTSTCVTASSTTEPVGAWTSTRQPRR
jgi:hypothetical protein